MEIIVINLFIKRGDYLIKYILIIGFIFFMYVFIFALIKVARDFDNEAEEF